MNKWDNKRNDNTNDNRYNNKIKVYMRKGCPQKSDRLTK